MPTVLRPLPKFDLAIKALSKLRKITCKIFERQIEELISSILAEIRIRIPLLTPWKLVKPSIGTKQCDQIWRFIGLWAPF